MEVEVLAPAYRGSSDQEVAGVKVHRFRYAPAALETLTHDQTAPDRVRERPWYLSLVPGYVWAGSRAAARLAGTGEFDLVHAFWPIPHGLMGLAAKRRGGIPLVSTFFGVELSWVESQLGLLRPVVRRIIDGSDAVTVISSHTARAVRRISPGAELETIPFGVTLPSSGPAPPRLRVPGSPMRLLFAGRLVERKGVDVLLQALALLDPSLPITLSVVGDGPIRPRLEEEAVRLGLDQRVHFAGFVSSDELGRHFEECDALLLPAKIDEKGDTEGLGVVLIEALSLRRPVIASRAGGILDIVEDGRTGLLVPPGDAQALAEAILRYFTDPDLAGAHAGAGQAHVQTAFSWDSIIDRLIGLYGRIAAAERG